MRKIIKDEVLVLDRQVYGDAHRILVLLGAQTGKITAIAHHARRSKKRFGGSLELFSRIHALLEDRGRGGMLHLHEAQLVDSHPGIRTDLISIAHAGYISELTSALLKEGQGGDRVFELLSRALQKLDSSPMSNLELRRFELEILDAVGLAPEIVHCVSCGTDTSKIWLFDPDEGGIVCDSCTHGSYCLPFSQASLEFLRSLENPSGTRSPVKESASTMNECRSLLATLIDQHTGRKLKAREFLRKLAMG